MNQANQALNRVLERKTRDYHSLLKQLQSPDRLLTTLESYVDSLLPLEMERVRPRSPTPSSECHTLVLLVGYSLEPLLQSICFYQPQRIVLVLNEVYGREEGYVMGEHIESLVRRLEQTQAYQSQEPLLKRHPKLDPRSGQGQFRSVKADPAQVFRLLLETLRSELPKHVVVDITGAKKSMVAGAFFYAAFANIAISYVEFDDEGYDLSLGRPEGHRSTIQQLSNPYATFALREWIRLRHLYNQYNFRDARELLIEQILPVMTQPLPDSDERLFKDKQIDAVKALIKVLKFYDRWERGDFQLAAALSPVIPQDKWPLAVRALPQLLPDNLDRKDGIKAAAQLVTHLSKQVALDNEGRSFFLKPKLLGVYAADETARIGRLIDYHRDYRSALMRATGLYELLLQARILTLWYLGHFQSQAHTAEDLYKLLAEKMSGLSKIEEFVFKNEAYTVDEVRIYWPDDRKWRIPENAKLPDKIRELRHKTTHRAVPVPESTARLALDILTRSLENYCTTWAPHLEPRLSIPPPDAQAFHSQPWSAVCQWCDLVQILTPNLLEDEGEEK